ncbi:MAG: hypothetical protein HXN82_06655 [Prevotella pallens]|nr:hypothetical protein [Prevotella pallens]
MKDKNYWAKWAKAAARRALKTAAQTFVATIGTTATLGAVDWKLVGSTAALAAILSIGMSFAGLPEVDPNKTTEEDLK